MEFWNIGFKTEKKFLPTIPLFQLSSVPKYFFHYSIVPLFQWFWFIVYRLMFIVPK